MTGNTMLGLADGLPYESDGSLAKYAWPGGYALVYYTADGSELCADCANAVLVSNVEWRSRLPLECDDWREWAVGLDETIVGAQSMDATDSCVYCDNCNRCVLASGCDADLYMDSVTDAPVVHGEYCSYRDDVADDPRYWDEPLSDTDLFRTGRDAS